MPKQNSPHDRPRPGLPHRTAPELVGKDLDAIRATLKQEVHGALADMEREFTKRLNQMGSEE